MSEIERRVRDVTVEFPRPHAQVTRRVERRVLALLPSIRVRSATALSVLALVAALSLGVVLGHWDATASRSGPAAAPVRSVDLTLLCTTPDLGGGYREIKLSAISARRARSYPHGASINIEEGVLGRTPYVAAAGPDPRAMGRGGLFYRRTRCSQSRARIPLTRSGLAGRASVELTPVPATGWRSNWAVSDCEVGVRVFVRVRATLQTAGSWEVFGRNREQRGIRRTVTRATIAVATHPGRRPLGYATLDAAGNTRLFTARSCS